MQGRIRRNSLVRRRRPDARRPMLELVLDLRDAERQELVDRLLGLHACEARHKLPERAHGVRFCVRARVVEHELEHKVKECIREVQAHSVERALDRLEDRFFDLATSRALLAALFGEVLEEREDAPEERSDPVSEAGGALARKSALFFPAKRGYGGRVDAGGELGGLNVHDVLGRRIAR